MTELVKKPSVDPEPPDFGMLIAVLLELSIVATFVANRSVLGLVLCAGYVWFSATWAFFASKGPQ